MSIARSYNEGSAPLKPTILARSSSVQFEDERGTATPESVDASPSLELGDSKSPRPTVASGADAELVDWDGDNDPANPKNWSSASKWVVTLIMSAYSFVTLMSSSMIAPTLPAIAQDFGITSDVESQIIFSAFILAGAVGPLLFAPLSEIYGRRLVTQCGGAFYLIWTIVCGFAPTKEVLITGRFLSGLGACVIFGVQYGLLSDCWRASERGKSMAIINFAPLLGPALGPIFGGFVVQATTWRWVFWSTALFSGALQLLAVFLLWETYAPVLLARKAQSLRQSTGNMQLRTAYDTPNRSSGRILRTSLMRPLRIMMSHPAVQLVTVYTCIVFGTLYILLSNFATMWIDRYHQSASDSGLHYLAIALGFIVGSVACARALDYLWERSEAPIPEQRCVFLLPGALGLAAGLLVYGWSVTYRVHWIGPDIGAVVLGVAIQVSFAAVGAYLTDTYGRFAASASAGSFAVRSLCAFGFPLFAPQLYGSLGYGWGNTVLAGVVILVGFVVPLVMWKKGTQWRTSIRWELIE